VGDSIDEVGYELVKGIVNDDYSLITIFYGNEIEEEKAYQFAERLEEEFEDFDIEVIFGGQPLYYYIISIE